MRTTYNSLLIPLFSQAWISQVVIIPSLLLDRFPSVSQLIAYWHLLQTIWQKEKDIKCRSHQLSHLRVGHFLDLRCGMVRLYFHYAKIITGDVRLSGNHLVVYFIWLVIISFYSFITELSAWGLKWSLALISLLLIIIQILPYFPVEG